MGNNLTKTEQLLQILDKNISVQKIFERTIELMMPNWYLGAGGIVQTVWNVKHGFDPENGIKDYDLVYYDEDISVLVEIRNQARVHLWYEKHFGKPMDQYKSIEDAISTWPTTATSIGIRKDADGNFKVYAPFGLDDLLGMVVRANKAKITEKIHRDKVERWTKIWPNLQIIPW